MSKVDLNLVRNAFGRLVLTRSDGQQFEGVVPVRAFPLQAANECISILDDQGEELAWIDRLSDLTKDTLRLVIEELDCREMMPVIRKITRVSSFTTPSSWDVETDRGATSFILDDEGDIRRINLKAVLISDSHGIPFFINNIETLDKHSKNLLERFV